MKFICHKQEDIEEVQSALSTVSLEKPIEVTIKEYTLTRTEAQNRLMHMWFNAISEHVYLTQDVIFSPEIWKDELKEKFLGFDFVERPSGKIVAKVKKTSKCSVKELSEFLEKVDHYCVTRLELMLPRPSEIYFKAMGLSPPVKNIFTK